MARARQARGRIATTGARLQEKYDDIEEDVMEKYENLAQQVIDLEQRFEDKVREKPLQSVGISLGVGLIAGALLMGMLKRR
jgi:ElaB/YqjD/DUF883 family membrane-anchored ribosome-binding protein